MDQLSKVVKLRPDPIQERRALVQETAHSLSDTVAGAGVVVSLSGEVRIVAVNIEPEIAHLIADAMSELSDEIRLKRMMIERADREDFDMGFPPDAIGDESCY